MTSINTPKLFIKRNQIKTTSINVGETFGKTHKNVLRAIENLDCSKEFHRRNFEPIFYEDSYGRKQQAYEITRDGFVFLAMGFTGKKAAQWKEKYIECFNLMEKTLLQQQNLEWQQ